MDLTRLLGKGCAAAFLLALSQSLSAPDADDVLAVLALDGADDQELAGRTDEVLIDVVVTQHRSKLTGLHRHLVCACDVGQAQSQDRLGVVDAVADFGQQTRVDQLEVTELTLVYLAKGVQDVGRLQIVVERGIASR